MVLSTSLVGSLIGACQEEAKTVASEDFIEQERVARCTFFVRCGVSPNRETCLASEEPDRVLVQALGRVPFGAVSYDGEAAAEFIDALQERSCDSTIAARRESEDLRRAVFEGEAAVEGACFIDDDCEGEAVCDRTMCPDGQGCCTGVCVQTEIVPVGSPCPLTDPAARLRTRCDDDAQCAAMMDAPDESDTGICTARVDQGQPCNGDQECLDGQRCSPEGRTCFILSGETDPCNPALGPAACLDFDKTCSADGFCGPLPGDGQPCVEGRCQAFADCVEETCIARSAAGENCMERPCLGDLRCVDGVCELETVQLVCIAGDPPPPPAE
jgi:hypothetical protein